MKKSLLITLLTCALVFSFGCRSKNNSTSLYDNPESLTNKTTMSESETEMRTIPEKGDQVATLKTTEGEIKIFFFDELAPETVKNFTEHAKAGRYNGVPFHRVIDEFMIQTGDFETGQGYGGYSYEGPGTNLADEFGEGLTHLRGAVSMANKNAPNTGGSQFFIVQRAEGTKSLDGKHAIFGFVYDGMDVVDAIATTETDFEDRPVEDILIEEVVLAEY